MGGKATGRAVHEWRVVRVPAIGFILRLLHKATRRGFWRETRALGGERL